MIETHSTGAVRRSPCRPERDADVGRDAAAGADFLAADSLCDALTLLKQVVASLTHEVDRRLAGEKLTLAKAMPLRLMLESPCSTVTAIARCGHCDAGAVTRTVFELEGLGMLSRARALDDRRVVQLTLTTRGRRVAVALPALVEAATDLHFAGFASEGRQVMMSYLQRLTLNGAGGSRWPTEGLPAPAS